MPPESGISLDDATHYAQCMSRIRNRLNVIDDVLAGRLDLSRFEDVQAEVIFVQFRKSLEELAFATLSANRDIYSAVHTKFSVYWRAKDLLTDLEEMNKDFYPVPVERVGEMLFHPISSGYLTRDDFVRLYQFSSEVMHSRNPYKQGDPTISIGFPVQEWLARFRLLIGRHIARLANGDLIFAQVPNQGHVRVSLATPSEDKPEEVPVRVSLPMPGVSLRTVDEHPSQEDPGVDHVQPIPDQTGN